MKYTDVVILLGIDTYEGFAFVSTSEVTNLMHRLAMQCTAERRSSTSLWPGSPYFRRMPFCPRRSGRCWGNKRQLSYEVAQTKTRITSVDKIGLTPCLGKPYPLTAGSVGVQHRGEREQDFCVCPWAARVQCAYGVWHEHIQCLLVHDNLRARKIRVQSLRFSQWVTVDPEPNPRNTRHKTGICIHIHTLWACFKRWEETPEPRIHSSGHRVNTWNSAQSSGSLGSGNAANAAPQRLPEQLSSLCNRDIPVAGSEAGVSTGTVSQRGVLGCEAPIGSPAQAAHTRPVKD